MQRLQSAIASSLGAENLKYNRDSSGIDMVALQGEFPKWLKDHTLLSAVREIEQLSGGAAQAVMINKLLPGKIVQPHTDEATGWRRYHLPLLTNAEAWWWDEEGGTVYMDYGYWWGPVNTSIMHQVGNGGNTDRIHLVVDVS